MAVSEYRAQRGLEKGDYLQIYLAGGCFWGTQKYFDHIKGVCYTSVGYANGITENPTYQQVCHENTGHAETVRVVFDPKMISLEQLLPYYFDVINPVSINQQGEDIGTQYRTGIYYTDTAYLPVIRQAIAALQLQYDQPIAIEVKPLENYFTAEEYHQKYLDKNPAGYCHISWSKIEQAAEKSSGGETM